MNKFLFLVCTLIYSVHYSQNYYTQNFNTPGLNGWVSTDIDGDTQKWENTDASGANSNFGVGSLVSYLPTPPPPNPNNLAASPLINLSTVTASNVYLTYDLQTHPTYPNEQYSIYVTTNNTPATIVASTPVYTETVAVGGFQSRSINLSAFIGQQVYLSFRHRGGQRYLIIDNIQVKSIATNDASLKNISLSRYGIINNNYSLKATIKNNGSQPINSITANWNDGTTDHITTIPVSPAVNSGQETTITHPIAVNYASIVEKNMNINIAQVNGGLDGNPADNTLTTKFNTVSQSSPKKVLLEEGTGTWCGYCPRGAVGMAYMDANYPNDFTGIAVHNGDPMAVSAYLAGAQFDGYPSLNVDRIILNDDASQTVMTSHVNTRKTLVIPAKLDASSTLTGNSLTFNASATFRTNFTNANFRFAVVLTEDGVTGTTSGYNQTNYYSGTSLPVYGALPNPVPAAQMVYNHVGRMLLGGYSGQAGSIPAAIIDGQVVNYTFTATIPSAYNTNNMKAVLLLLDANTGEVVNSRSFLLNTLGTNEAQTNANYLTIYPNPATDYIKVQADYNVDLKFYDAAGRIILEKTNVSPDSLVSIAGVAKGVYYVSIQEKDRQPKTQKLIIK